MKDDARLIADIVEELASDPGVDSSRIAVGAKDGVVTLSGTVPSYWQKIEAENAAKRVTGVRAVANDLEVELPGERRRDDTDIARAAANALAWHSELPDTIKSLGQQRLDHAFRDRGLGVSTARGGVGRQIFERCQRRRE